MELRPYQAENKAAIYAAWDAGASNVLDVMPTGGGKTVVVSSILTENRGGSCAIVHRQELVTQMSLTLARCGLKHRIIGPKNVVKVAVGQHMDELNRSFYDPSAQCAVAGVDTLVRRGAELSSWLKTVSLWVQDEAHHVLVKNKWGTAASMFPNARGLGVTATPMRADGCGLGRHSDGLFDDMVVGPSGRWLIDQGYLTDYRVIAPPNDLNLSTVEISKATGEYNPNQLKMATRKSRIVGDVVEHYLKFAAGKLGITFATDVETATDIARQFNIAGVPAAVVSAKTNVVERVEILRKFRNRELLQLVNVDLFGEGFDLPAIEVVSMARATQSFGLYCQQFGRALRIMDGKLCAIIIDHVGNVDRHKLPDGERMWTLDRREKRSQCTPDDIMPLRTCMNKECLAVYERIYNMCPYCNHKVTPTRRDGPEFVDGDLLELDQETLAAMRGDVARIDRPASEYREELEAKHAPRIGVLAGVKRHNQNQEAQAALRSSIAWWAGYQRAKKRPDSESYSRFYFEFGIDVLGAKALKTKDALTLASKINHKLGDMAV